MAKRHFSSSSKIDSPLKGFRYPEACFGVVHSLARLALDIRWSWNHATDGIWRQLDPDLWGHTHNPWIVLQTTSRKRIQAAFADPEFQKNVDELLGTMVASETSESWFQKEHAGSSLTCVAYFCMEFMLSEALPIYSGNWATSPATSSRRPATWVCQWWASGCSTSNGYFRQAIDREGAQQEFYPYNDAANFPAHRGITSELYGGGPQADLREPGCPGDRIGRRQRHRERGPDLKTIG